MAEDLVINDGDKIEKYETVIPQIESLIAHENDPVANLANTVAALWQTFGFFWIGFYRVEGEELVLGPFQGPVACTRIPKGKGVCGSAWQENKTLLVPDVELFPGHIACASQSRSEIVVPISSKSGAVKYVLDVDSDKLNDFDEVDQRYLEKVAELVSKYA